jgi:hypothetical protein
MQLPTPWLGFAETRLLNYKIVLWKINVLATKFVITCEMKDQLLFHDAWLLKYKIWKLENIFSEKALESLSLEWGWDHLIQSLIQMFKAASF